MYEMCLFSNWTVLSLDSEVEEVTKERTSELLLVVDLV